MKTHLGSWIIAAGIVVAAFILAIAPRIQYWLTPPSGIHP